jgi:hypothetical protein
VPALRLANAAPAAGSETLNADALALAFGSPSPFAGVSTPSNRLSAFNSQRSKGEAEIAAALSRFQGTFGGSVVRPPPLGAFDETDDDPSQPWTAGWGVVPDTSAKPAAASRPVALPSGVDDNDAEALRHALSETRISLAMLEQEKRRQDEATEELTSRVQLEAQDAVRRQRIRAIGLEKEVESLRAELTRRERKGAGGVAIENGAADDEEAAMMEAVKQAAMACAQVEAELADARAEAEGLKARCQVLEEALYHAVASAARGHMIDADASTDLASLAARLWESAEARTDEDSLSATQGDASADLFSDSVSSFHSADGVSDIEVSSPSPRGRGLSLDGALLDKRASRGEMPEDRAESVIGLLRRGSLQAHAAQLRRLSRTSNSSSGHEAAAPIPKRRPEPSSPLPPPPPGAFPNQQSMLLSPHGTSAIFEAQPPHAEQAEPEIHVPSTDADTPDAPPAPTQQPPAPLALAASASSASLAAPAPASAPAALANTSLAPLHASDQPYPASEASAGRPSMSPSPSPSIPRRMASSTWPKPPSDAPPSPRALESAMSAYGTPAAPSPSSETGRLDAAAAEADEVVPAYRPGVPGRRASLLLETASALADEDQHGPLEPRTRSAGSQRRRRRHVERTGSRASDSPQSSIVGVESAAGSVRGSVIGPQPPLARLGSRTSISSSRSRHSGSTSSIVAGSRSWAPPSIASSGSSGSAEAIAARSPNSAPAHRAFVGSHYFGGSGGGPAIAPSSPAAVAPPSSSGTAAAGQRPRRRNYSSQAPAVAGSMR